tara:strand:+ start:405 stop:1832 length:1428 start_codon:yes stop_codon:yes gene_type:complete
LNTDLPKSYKIDKNKFQNDLQKILKSKITILNEDHILYRTNKKIKKLKENIKKDLKQGRCNLLCRNKINEILNFSKTDLFLYSRIEEIKNKYKFKISIYKYNESFSKKYNLNIENDFDEIINELVVEIRRFVNIDHKIRSNQNEKRLKNNKNNEDNFYYDSLILPSTFRKPRSYFSLNYGISTLQINYDFKTKPEYISKIQLEYKNYISNYISLGIPLNFLRTGEIILDLSQTEYKVEYDVDYTFSNIFYESKQVTSYRNNRYKIFFNKYWNNLIQINLFYENYISRQKTEYTGRLYSINSDYLNKVENNYGLQSIITTYPNFFINYRWISETKFKLDTDSDSYNSITGSGSSNLLGLIYNNKNTLLNISYFKENSLIRDGKTSSMNINKNTFFEFLYFEKFSLNISYTLYENYNTDGSRRSTHEQYTLKNDYEHFENFVLSIIYLYSKSRSDNRNNYLDSNVQMYGFLVNYDFK